ncbi:lanthionine synthetase C family protein [Lentzea sp. NPDC004782]|uniref:lanthionine synthetase C family protein n=1 Tax=Lentzea sp. NPDC004782 TaxID=3154458 RepID=UPI0033B44163
MTTALDTTAALIERLANLDALSSLPTGWRRGPQSLGGGAAGIALLHIERARSGLGSWDTAHAWLSAAVSDELTAGPNAGLFFGTPALAFVIHTAVDRSGKLNGALQKLDSGTVDLTGRRLRQAHARLDRTDRPPMAEFDLICGLAGLGAHHLLHQPRHEITTDVLSYLVRLSEPLAEHADGLPGWWTDVGTTGAVTPDFPGGHGNLAMSHGISAPLALLSLALRRGIVVDGHREAITRICAWLDSWRQDDNFGSWWPGFVTPAHVENRTVSSNSRQKLSWCYGTPGIVRAQQLAGLALADVERQRLAENAMLTCLTDASQIDRIREVGLCHGIAGVLQTTWRMASDALTPALAAQVPRLVDALLHRIVSSPTATAEFLDGEAGVALALHTAVTDTAPQGSWDSCLLLA